jgi:murein DD-endopeptidase MepM/ murein hydrolase activator NlpD
MLFPLHKLPAASWKDGGRQFGSGRSNGRKHAGCDLLAPVGTPVRAVAPGIVVAHQPFYDETWYLVVDHDTFTVRYGEIKKQLPPGVRVGQPVMTGQIIAQVGLLVSLRKSMLHFEMYAGTKTGRLTVRENKPYQRRADLIDPTPFLDTAVMDMGGSPVDVPLFSQFRNLRVA